MRQTTECKKRKPRKPLTSNQPKLAVECKKRKPRKPLTPDQQELAVQFLPLARSMAKPLKKRFPQYWEEFESAACMALVQAAEAFDPSRKTQFSTFASVRIRGALLDVKRNRRARLRSPDPTGPAHYLPFEKVPNDQARMLIASPEPEVGSEFEAIDLVEGCLKKLPQKHADACKQIYLHGKTHVETSKVIGMSASRVSSLHLEALQMLSGSLPGMYKSPISNKMVVN